MRVIIALLLLGLAGCVKTEEKQPTPPPQYWQQPGQPCPDGSCRPPTGSITTDVPPMLREPNYKGGSCVHAAWVVSLRMQGLEDWADWWRANYAYGEYPKRLAARADRAGLKYAYTLRGDADFLDWCSRTNRPATIGYFWRHSINFICFEGGQAKLLDNNRTHKYLWVPRGEFLRRWRGYGGWAVVPIAEPVPPTPWIART